MIYSLPFIYDNEHAFCMNFTK